MVRLNEKSNRETYSRKKDAEFKNEKKKKNNSSSLILTFFFKKVSKNLVFPLNRMYLFS